MARHQYPQVSTIKKLFALAGNQCAFHNCETTLVDNTSGKITAEICHIKAKSKNGPRFDSQQTADENRSYENLILMCPIHHSIIDTNLDLYTVNKLYEFKKNHEEKFKNISSQEINDEAIKNLIENTYSTIYNQTADTIIINNYSENKELYNFKKNIESLQELQKIHTYIKPIKRFQDMNWGDALLDITLSFSSIKEKIDNYLIGFVGFYNFETEIKLNECLSICIE